MKELTGLGFTLPRETIQPALDALTSKLTDELPMDIKADSVEVTDDGVRDPVLDPERDDPARARTTPASESL